MSAKVAKGNEGRGNVTVPGIIGKKLSNVKSAKLPTGVLADGASGPVQKRRRQDEEQERQ
jgi:hypothetical protein